MSQAITNKKSHPMGSAAWLWLAVVTLATCCCLMMATPGAEAKLLRLPRYQDDYLGGYDNGPYASGATGERAIVTVRGARNPYDGSAPSKITIEDNPYRGAYPRGVYDRLDGYGGAAGGGRYPRMDPYGGYGMAGYNGPYGGYGSGSERRDFLDPDFGVRTSLNLAGRERSKCRLSGDADSEIPALGLDSAHLNVDCDINPARVMKAATRVAKKYGDYRRRRKQQPSSTRRKVTRINIDSEFETNKGGYNANDDRSNHNHHDKDQDQDQDDDDD